MLKSEAICGDSAASIMAADRRSHRRAILAWDQASR